MPRRRTGPRSAPKAAPKATPKDPPRRRPALYRTSYGGEGHRVFVQERRPGGSLHLRFWDADAAGGRGNWAWQSLRHADRVRAEAAARKLSADLLTASDAARTGRVTAEVVFARYEREMTPTKAPRSQEHDRRRLAVWRYFLAAQGVTDPMSIDRSVLDRFVMLRRTGKLRVPGLALRAVRDGAIECDLKFLTAVLNWAADVSAATSGRRLLPYNPIRGYKRPKEASPRRPLTTYQRFLALRAVADEVDPQGLLLPLLELAEALGWRIMALCQLQAADLDLSARPGHGPPDAPHGRIRKRGEADKQGVEMWVPLSPAARAAAETLLERRPAVGRAWLFPSPRSELKHWSIVHAHRLHRRAQLLAARREAQAEGRVFNPELVELHGWHAYRRKWVTERKHLPRKDVAAAGGWKSTRTLEIYEQVDPATLYLVVAEPRKLGAIGAAGAGGFSGWGECTDPKVGATVARAVAEG